MIFEFPVPKNMEKIKKIKNISVSKIQEGGKKYPLGWKRWPKYIAWVEQN